ncbi:MAG: DUF1189 family protein [Candidatus Paceibacterota bacterium]|jgi:hypothetical protein
MTIFKTIKDSVYNPAFYVEQKSTSLGKAFKYFFKLILLVTIITAIVACFQVIPIISNVFSQETFDILTNAFPQELKITFQDGQVSTNVQEPYYIPLPEVLSNKFSNKTEEEIIPENILVIDTKSSLTPELFDDNKTFAFLTRDYLVYPDNNKGKLSVQSLKSVPNMVLDKVKFGEEISKIQPYIKLVIPFIIVGFFAGLFFIYTIVNLLTITIGSFIFWIINKVRKIDVTYRQAFKLGLYAITLAIIIDVVLGIIFGVNIPWYIYLLISLISMFVNTEKKVNV